MTKPRPKAHVPAPDRTHIWAGAALAGAVAITYAGVYSVPFLFDDRPAIVTENPTIRSLWTFWEAFNPPHAHGQTVGGRPLPNLTLAINYAISGISPWSYHLFNVLIHVLAALALFGLVRRSLVKVGARPGAGSGLSKRLAAASLPIAFSAALLWALHPLATEAVTYVIQRVESLMALFYLLTLYCFLRSTDEAKPDRWLWASGICCLLGMASKEVMATAPVAVLLLDRWCVSGGIVASFRARPRYYLGLASTWLLMALLVVTSQGRGGTAGFGLGANLWNHAITQTYALGHYLWLSLWPHGLVFDYGFFIVKDPWSVLPQAVLLVGLLAAAGYGLWRNSVWGFPAALYFLILSPSTLIPIPVQTMAEHRMYLPLAILCVCVAAIAVLWLGRVGFALLVCLAAALGLATADRNEDYQSDLSIWTTTATNHPAGSARACFNAAGILASAGRVDEAIAQLRRAIFIEPRFAGAYDNLGTLWLTKGRTEAAVRFYRKSIQLDPVATNPYLHAGTLLEQTGRESEAISLFEEALKIDPSLSAAQLELGNAYFRQGRYDEALAEFEMAERAGPLTAEVDNNIGSIWFQRRNFDKAIQYFRLALKVGRDSDDTRVNLGNALAVTGRLAEAADQYKAALRLDPTDDQARSNLARVEAMLGGQN